jgi:hypothetical protein
MPSNGEYFPNNRYLARVQPVNVEGQANDNVSCSPVGGDGNGSCRLGADRDGGHVPGSSRPIPVRPITTKWPFVQGRESCDTLHDATSSSS